MIEKVRRVDFAPDEWLGGTTRLSDAECGIYIRACALIYSQGGPITRADLRGVCKGRGARFQRGLNSLIRHGKLIVLDAERLDQARCEVELARARRRIQAGMEGAKARWDQAEQPAENSPPGAHEGHTKVTRALHEGHTKVTRNDPVSNETNAVADGSAMPTKNRQRQEESKVFKKPKGDLGSAYAREGALAREAPPEPHSAEDKAAVDRLVSDTIAVFRLGTTVRRDGVYRPDAYRQAVAAVKRDQWLNALARFVNEAFDDMPARMAAREAIEQARNAGSRDATPPDVRRALDKIARLRDSLNAYAQAAE